MRVGAVAPRSQTHEALTEMEQTQTIFGHGRARTCRGGQPAIIPPLQVVRSLRGEFVLGDEIAIGVPGRVAEQRGDYHHANQQGQKADCGNSYDEGGPQQHGR